MSTAPTAVRLDPAASLLELRWGDERVSRYAGAYLRWICPCAACRGHAPGEVEPPRWEEVADVRLRHAQPVGTYALRFDFSDGHATGIYTYAWLREHCPSTRADVDDEGRPVG